MVEFATPTREGRRGHLYQAAIKPFLIHAVDLRPWQIQAAERYFALIFSINRIDAYHAGYRYTIVRIETEGGNGLTFIIERV